ncbi:glycosyl hydrolase 53 family protein [Lutibacter sp. B1]|uniref:glycoside hydrolase family 53 protein n=1 Tax=Lutibacter sp. B1 TaxID=2725996 RepID=UPI0014574D5D|nr:glycosyl hydrolase 53 family protein [Lutibacter sp. B1]NLP56926.1 arabinogalactan endo-1,4-beta-galactosidase [Lutibacter sp. B1]
MITNQISYKQFIYLLVLIPIFLFSCSGDNDNDLDSDKIDEVDEIEEVDETDSDYISAADLSLLPKIENTNAVFYNLENQTEDVLTTLKNNGVNTIRLRIWHTPEDSHSSFDEVKSFSEKIHAKGLKVWITVHYSDTWADPANQTPPTNWQGLTFNDLKDKMYTYTKSIVTEIQPDFIQIGNEINSGMLFPFGTIESNETQFISLLSEGVKAVRDNSTKTKIIIHFAGIEGSDWFYNKVKNIDYDIIGLSYYPIWHGKDLNNLKSTLNSLSTTYNKDILIAETAYPFTLDWNDWTDNIVGLEEQLILPDYPATPTGQKDFIAKIKEIVTQTNEGIGFCYWGGELIAFDGPESKNGSSWENQALFDFDNKALPVLSEFKIE